MKIIAAAVTDPLDPRTFSGYSHHLFSHLRMQSVEVVPLATRILRAEDVWHGAFNIRALFRWPRRQPLVDPNWFWSRRAFEAMSGRFAKATRGAAGSDAVLQVGTHVMPKGSDLPLFCVTDATVRQVAEAGEFAIGSVRSAVVEEAISCQREVVARSAKIFVLSEWTAAGFMADYGVSREKVVVVGAGANVPSQVSRQIDTTSPYILFVGYDWERKGGPLLLESFRILRATVPKARLVIVGCSPPIDVPGVEVVGKLDRRSPSDRQRLLDLYAGATAFAILPTFDPFPNVLLEAALLGIPVVSTDEGSRREAVVHGRTGLLARSRDPDEVAGLLACLLTDPGLAETLGRAAQDRARLQFTWPIVARRIIDEMSASLWPSQPDQTPVGVEAGEAVERQT